MQIFISWSGYRSKQVAEYLQEWLPKVIPLNVWISKDIRAGSDWVRELDDALSEIIFGIICLTQENQDAPWILYEAGILSKSLNHDNIVPYLFGLDEIHPPLSMFQCSVANKRGTQRLIESIACHEKIRSMINPASVAKNFEANWPDLDARLEAFEKEEKSVVHKVLEIHKKQMKSCGWVVSALEKQIKDYFIDVKVDTRPLLGEEGHLETLTFTSRTTISEFLDKVFYKINESRRLETFTYGQQWLIRGKSGQIYDDPTLMTYITSRGQIPDNRLLSEIGMFEEEVFEVIPGPAFAPAD